MYVTRDRIAALDPNPCISNIRLDAYLISHDMHKHVQNINSPITYPQLELIQQLTKVISNKEHASRSRGQHT